MGCPDVAVFPCGTHGCGYLATSVHVFPSAVFLLLLLIPTPRPCLIQASVSSLSFDTDLAAGFALQGLLPAKAVSISQLRRSSRETSLVTFIGTCRSSGNPAVPRIWPQWLSVPKRLLVDAPLAFPSACCLFPTPCHPLPDLRAPPAGEGVHAVAPPRPSGHPSPAVPPSCASPLWTPLHLTNSCPSLIHLSAHRHRSRSPRLQSISRASRLRD